VTFATSVPAWALVALLAVVLALAIAAYRGVRSELGPARHAGLVCLRALTLVALVLVLMRPVRVEPRPQSGGMVAILVDRSASMSLADLGRPRLEVARQLVSEVLQPALTSRFLVETYHFGESLREAREAPDARATDRASRLGEALEDLRDRVRDRALAGVVVVSDGAVSLHSRQGTPYVPGVPVLAIPIGAEVAPADREVFGATIGDPRLQASLVDVSALVAAQGEGARPFDVRLSENGRQTDLQRVTPAADGSPRQVTFRVAPARDVATLFTVSVDNATSELTPLNNRQSVLAPPAGVPRRLLLVEGAPGHEHSFLKRSIEEDPGLQLDVVLRKGENQRGEATFYVQAAADRAVLLSQGIPVQREALFAYDAVVLANVDAALVPRDALSRLAEFVAIRGGGLVVLGARSFAAGGLSATPLEPVVPVEMVDRAGGLRRAGMSAREPFRVSLTPDGERHPVMRLGAAPDATRTAWSAAPALASTAPLGEPRAAAMVLAVTSAPGGVTRPLVAVQRYGRGRALVFGGEASWRWKMMLPSGDTTYDTFWRQALRWVAADASTPVAVAALVADGARVDVRAEVRDRAFEPVTDGTVRAVVADPGGRSFEVVMSRGPEAGVWAGRFEASDSGVHKVTVEARQGASVLGGAETWALVGGADQEFVRPARTDDGLRRLAEASGGRLVSPAEAGRVAEWLGKVAATTPAMAQRELWHSPWVWGTLVIALAAEWTLRRRWGLR
jgi:hypothetical protein